MATTPLVIHTPLLFLFLYSHSFLSCCILDTMCKDDGRSPFTESHFSCTKLALDNYTGSKLKFGKKIQKYALVTLHYVSKSSSPSLYLILTGFGTSTALCLVVESFSPDSLVFLTTLGLEVPFLVDCGLVPFFWSWGLDEPVTPLRASRGLLEVFILGCIRESIGFKGLRLNNPQ